MNVKKIVAGVLACCVIVGAFPAVSGISKSTAFTANAVDDAEYTEGTYELLKYKNYGDYIEISGCDQSATDVVIPAEIEGLPVTKIGYCAFLNCYDLKSVTIPDSVSSIGSDAFGACRSLTSITIPDSVTSIGIRAFSGCSSLTSIIIPDSVTNIQRYAFNRTPWLESKQKENPCVVVNGILIDGQTCSGNIVIPDGVICIGESAFFHCSDLFSVTIPDSVTSIEYSAFACCSSLTSVTIPDGVTSIGDGAFSACYGLTLINIPDSVSSIGEYAFESCLRLTSVTIPDSVTNIGENAFCFCYGLESITILNPDCEIYDDKNTICNENYIGASYSGVIRGFGDSTAQSYAEKYKYNFEIIGDTPVVSGDVNGDGKVTIADAVIVQSFILGNAELTDWKSADLYSDGIIDVFDLCMLKKLLIQK